MNIARHPQHALTGPAQAGSVLSVSGLFKSFGANDVLRGLDFTVQPGIATALNGANGSGKSTAMKCLIRLVEPTGGRIDLLGRDVLTLSDLHRDKFRIDDVAELEVSEIARQLRDLALLPRDKQVACFALGEIRKDLAHRKPAKPLDLARALDAFK